MSNTTRTEARRVTGHPPGMLQDDSRELTAWLAGKPDAMMHARDAVAKIRAEAAGQPIDGTWLVDHDLNGAPICIGRPLSLPSYDIPALDECRVIMVPPLEMLKRWTEAKQAMNNKPCRCGPDGCADSTCPARKP